MEQTGPEQTVAPEPPDPGIEQVERTDDPGPEEEPEVEVPGEEEVPEDEFHTPAEADADDEVDDKESETYA